MAELESEKEAAAWGDDDSKLNGSSTTYQDINLNQTGLSLDISQNNASVLSMLKQNNRVYRQHKHQQKQQQLHDTSNIDSLVTKSLEISRSYRKLNFSGLNNNNNNSIIYEAKYIAGENDENMPVISMDNVKPDKSSKKQPPERKPRHILTNSVTSTTSASLNGNSQKLQASNDFDLDKKNINLERQTENLLREYSDIKKQQQKLSANNNFEEKNGNSNKSSKKNDENSKSENSKKKSEHSNGTASNASKSSKQHQTAPMINEISEIMSESMDRKSSRKSNKNRNKNDSGSAEYIEVNEENEEEEDIDDGDYDSDEDSSIEELIQANDKLKKLNIKHESTKAFNSNDEEDDDDDDDEDDDDDDEDEEY
jgi:hypothetical protein